MIAVVQRVRSARVEVDARVVGAIDQGLLVLVCAEQGDGDAQVDKLIDKLLKLRVFADERGKMNLDVGAIHGGVMIVSQFTLAADTSRGNRPSFSRVAAPAEAQRLYDQLVVRMQLRHPKVASGVFGAEMQIHLINDGPVTLPIEIGPS